MMKTASLLAAGLAGLFAVQATAADPVLVDVPAPKPAAAPSPALCADAWPECPPTCPPLCDPGCGKGKKVKACPEVKACEVNACPAPAKIIVHQPAPLVEFRRDAASSAPCAAPPHEDRCVRPVGGEGPAGCGCQHAGWFKCKHCAHGAAAPALAAPAVTTAVTMAAVPVTLQAYAYVPQVVQTYSVAAYPAAVAPAAAVYPAAAVAPNDAVVRALADIIAAAGAAPPPRANGPAPAATADNGRLPALETKVQDLDRRLSSLERRLDALCKTR